MQKPTEQHPKAGEDSRKAAIALLLDILCDHKTVEEARSGNPAYHPLSLQDKAFCMQLVFTYLRYKGALERLLQQYLQKPIKASRLDIQCCLMTGAAQLLLMEVPDHAAVDLSVRLAKGYQPQMAGLVNAVLKKVAGPGRDWWQRQELEKLSVPNWLWQSWVKTYGAEQAAAIARAHLQTPPLDISLKTISAVTQWQEQLQAKALPTGSLRIHQTARPTSPSETKRHLQTRDLAEWPGFDSGDWWVQELAASLPVKIMGNLAGKSVLDCCAAPGGKTAQLAAADAEVLAVDQSPRRMERLQQNMNRLQLNTETHTVDLLSWQPDMRFDAILLDAPCSATGTIRRHPELPWQRSPRDLKRLVQLQQKLLHRIIEWLKPGGFLVYAVCSLQPEEGEEQIARFLESGKATLAPITADEIDRQQRWLNDNGTLRTLPCYLAEEGGMDGFFVARLHRPA